VLGLPWLSIEGCELLMMMMMTIRSIKPRERTIKTSTVRFDQNPPSFSRYEINLKNPVVCLFKETVRFKKNSIDCIGCETYA